MPTGRVVLVAGSGNGIAGVLARGLRRASAVPGPIESRSDAERAFSAAAGSDRVGAVVHVVLDPDALREEVLADTDEAEWERRCERVMCTALWCAQATYRVLAGHGGRLVFVTPTIGLTGAAGLVPYASAVEGVRSLAKCAARQWQQERISVNCVAPPTEFMRINAGGQEIVNLVGMLVSDRSGVVTGQTMVIDGGVVMVP